jgi:cytochrome c
VAICFAAGAPLCSQYNEKFSVKRNILFGIAVLIVVGAGLVWITAPNGHDHNMHGTSGANIKVPVLSKVAKQGEELFKANCAVCHGKNAAGTPNGPPLVHKIYEPSHHSNLSFQRAAKLGVRAHHWPFGNMPPVPDVTDMEVERVVAYVRELQRANGIR